MPFTPSLSYFHNGRRKGLGKTFEQYVAEVAEAARRCPPRKKYTTTPKQMANLVPGMGGRNVPKPHQRCTFVSARTGKHCKNWRMRGSYRCRCHGGYRQNPRHKGTIRLYTQGYLTDALQTKQSADAIKEQIPHQIRQQVTQHIKDRYTRAGYRGRRPTAENILLAARALIDDPTGKAYRRALNHIIQQR